MYKQRNNIPKNKIHWSHELYERWYSESPDFWKKIMKFSITLGTSAVAVLIAEKTFDLMLYGVPPIIFTICGYIITVCAAFGLAAKITKK